QGAASEGPGASARAAIVTRRAERRRRSGFAACRATEVAATTTGSRPLPTGHSLPNPPSQPAQAGFPSLLRRFQPPAPVPALRPLHSVHRPELPLQVAQKGLRGEGGAGGALAQLPGR